MGAAFVAAGYGFDRSTHSAGAAKLEPLRHQPPVWSYHGFPPRTEIPLGGDYATGLTSGFGSVWATVSGKGARLVRIDPRTNTVVRQTRVPWGVEDVVAGEGALWALQKAHCGPDVYSCVARIDPDTGRITGRVVIVGATLLTAGEGAAWAASGKLWRIDPVRARVTATVRLPRPALALATGFGAVWIAAADGRVFKVDAATARVVGASRRLGRFPATALTTAPSGVVSFTNVSRRRCTLRGVPRVGVLDAVGRILPVIVRGSWPRWRYHQPPVTWPHVIVRPKARPGFFARWRNWCSDARRVAFRVRLPHVRGHVDVPVEAGPGCDGPGSPSSLLVLPVGGDPD